MKRIRFTRVGLVIAMLAAVVVAIAASTGSAAPNKTLKVRVITCCPVTQGTWDPSHFKAYNAAAKQLGWNLQIAQTVPYGQADQVLGRWGGEGVDIVFSTDNGFQDHMLLAAKKYPKTLWVTMSDMSTTNGLKNVGAYTVDWCQLGYAQGVAAALVSKSHKIGIVGAIPILPAKKTLAGMQVGAELAVPGTKIVPQYSGDFIDAQKAQEVASALIDGGADVIIPVTQGSVSPQIAARVQDRGKWYLGSYGDETRFAPKATVTNAVVKFELGYRTVAQQRAAGTFAPGIHRGTIANGFIKLTPYRLGFAKLQAKTDALIKKAASGKVNLSACEAINK